MAYLLKLDEGILLFFQQYIRQDWMDGFWKFITFLGNYGWFWIALSAVLLISSRTRKAGAAALTALLIGALLTNVILKDLIARIRPYEVVEGLRLIIEEQHDYSFPSGHTCASFAAALTFYKIFPRCWGVPAVILAVLIAISRLYVGVHYPSDVLGGLLVGIFASWAALRLVKYVEERKKKAS